MKPIREDEAERQEYQEYFKKNKFFRKDLLKIEKYVKGAPSFMKRGEIGMATQMLRDVKFVVDTVLEEIADEFQMPELLDHVINEKVDAEMKKIYQLLIKYGNNAKDAAAMIKKNLKYVNKTYRNSSPRGKAVALVGLQAIGEAVVKVSKKDDVPGNIMKMSGEEKIKKLVYSGSINNKGSYEIKGKNLNVIGIRPRDKGFFVRHFTMKTGFRKANLYYDGVNWMNKNKKF